MTTTSPSVHLAAGPSNTSSHDPASFIRVMAQLPVPRDEVVEWLFVPFLSIPRSGPQHITDGTNILRWIRYAAGVVLGTSHVTLSYTRDLTPNFEYDAPLADAISNIYAHVAEADRDHLLPAEPGLAAEPGRAVKHTAQTLPSRSLRHVREPTGTQLESWPPNQLFNHVYDAAVLHTFGVGPEANAALLDMTARYYGLGGCKSAQERVQAQLKQRRAKQEVARNNTQYQDEFPMFGHWQHVLPREIRAELYAHCKRNAEKAVQATSAAKVDAWRKILSTVHD
ncbi:hypothetical protein BKA62DRAFT_783259 [Auriculariales sp. MPI-PUGE-AT-0066]|nr:hypothetical protein BKA62DRAFT_783259 [Auriculariales sp. MPI-PUGE-AT-0066]